MTYNQADAVTIWHEDTYDDNIVSVETIVTQGRSFIIIYCFLSDTCAIRTLKPCMPTIIYVSNCLLLVLVLDKCEIGARQIVGEADRFHNFLGIAHVAIDTEGEGIFGFEYKG